MNNSPKNKQPTHSQIIMSHMLAGQTLSNMQAYHLYSMTSSLRRISELRAAGVPIRDKVIKQNGKRFKRYWIDQPTTNNDEVTV
ncbi:helix-turn-helix domain-containing protein [Psychrobacter sp. SWN149]|uniref:helix-turn-helix domain-containing protein n=1 Tax=Psychrobacter sp. SWN149 TaxID=2792057 RepID=UPI0018CE0BC8|nr:helix-turn-helix domain-containing protein [Psychrobacter sp. SWN149]MBH0007388.1 hypothetical protein [Psychrobacter sp. SWN149]